MTVVELLSNVIKGKVIRVKYKSIDKWIHYKGRVESVVVSSERYQGEWFIIDFEGGGFCATIGLDEEFEVEE